MGGCRSCPFPCPRPGKGRPPQKPAGNSWTMHPSSPSPTSGAPTAPPPDRRQNDKRRCNPKHLKHADAYDHSQDTDIWFWDGRAMRNRANHLAAKLNPLGKGRFTGHQPVRDANCDGVPDNVDPDANGDGVANAARTNLPDTDGDGVPDAAQIDLADSNGDGVPNAV